VTVAGLRRTRVLGLLVSVTVAAGAAAPTALGGGLGVPISPDGPITPAVVADGGSLLSVWATRGSPQRLLAREWPGHVGPPTVTVGRGDSLLALDAHAGDAVAVFGRRWARKGAELFASVRRGGTWRPAVRLGRQTGRWFLRTGVGVVSTRRVVVVAWVRQHPSRPWQLWTRLWSGGHELTRLVDSGEGLDAPRLVTTRKGSVALGWEKFGVVRVVVRRADGAWTDPRDLAAAGMLLALAGGPASDSALVAWSSLTPPTFQAYAADLGDEGTVDHVERLAGDMDRAAAAVGPAGRAVLAWRAVGGRRGRTAVVKAVTRGVRGRWSAPIALSRSWRIPSPSSPPAAAFTADARAVVAWGREGVVQARVLSSGRWSPARDLVGTRRSPATLHAAVALGHRPFVATVWPASGGRGPLRIQPAAARR
jgi:hypothetical protein